MTTKENLKLQIEWFNYFADYIKQYDINLYNDSCAHADNIERQILENEFLQFPELEEEEENNTCYECGEDIDQEERFCSKECYDNSFNERI